LFVILLVVAAMIVRARSLFVAVVLGGMFSLLCTGIYTLLDAVDVAFTEASVGAGVSTVLFLGALALSGDEEKAPGKRPWLGLLVAVGVGMALLYGTNGMPLYGDYSAPIHHHVVPRYIEESPQEIGVPNFVTSVLASYRGYDTLGETTVVFTAAVGVLSLLAGAATNSGGLELDTSKRPLPEPPPNEEPLRATDERSEQLPHLSPRFQGSSTFPRTANSPRYHTRLQDVPVVRIVAKAIIPFILLFALYVQFHGDFGPGGGFQAGVIFAAGLILYAIIFGKPALQAVLPWSVVEVGIGAGVLIYGGTGVISLLRGLNFLDYYAFGHHGQEWGIFLVELGVGITVTSVMVAIFYAFAGRARARERG
jgi:multicomponent Na+:H+ antiporter subunit B